MFEDDEPEERESQPGALDGARNAINRIGLGTILAVLILFGILWFALFVVPRPVSVDLTLKNADGEAVSGALVSARYPQFPFGTTNAVAFELRDGTYRFKSVPSNAKMDVTISADGYEDPGESVQTGGEDTRAQMLLYRSSKIRFDSDKLSASIGSACSKTFYAPVTNGGDTVQKLSLTWDGEADAPISFSSGTLDVLAASASGTIPFTLTTAYEKAPAETVKGTVRLAGTDKTAQVLLTVTQKATLSYSPAELSMSPSEKTAITLSNNDKNAITGVTLQYGAALEKIVQIDRVDKFDLEPGAKKIIFATALSEGTGKLTLVADCIPPKDIAVYVTKG